MPPGFLSNGPKSLHAQFDKLCIMWGGGAVLNAQIPLLTYQFPPEQLESSKFTCSYNTVLFYKLRAKGLVENIF